MKIEDNCGLFGFSGNGDCLKFLEVGGFNLQHRGQKFCGISTSDGKKLYWGQPQPGLVKENFTRWAKEDLRGGKGIIHVGIKEPQPFLVNNPKKQGRFAIAFSGRIVNQEKLEEEYNILSPSDPAVQILASIIVKNGDFIEGIKGILREVEGGWAILILTEKGDIIAARDRYGFRPLILGRSIEGCAVASESVSLDKIGMDIVRDVQPGEIVILEPTGFRTICQLESKRSAFCSFEWGYIAHISSILDTMPVKRARKNIGAELAKRDRIEGFKADLVAAVPMSGIGYAIGYAQESGISYDEVFGWNRYSDRSYPRLVQEEREAIAEEKLSIIKETTENKVIILIDDSIVRGTQIRKLIFKLTERGAKEVHLRIACPPLVAPCHYNVSTRTPEELVANRCSIEEIGKMVGAKTIRFNTLDGFVRAIGLPRESLCLACFTGEYPDCQK